VLMLDIDHFKQLNDTYGHEAGDVVLREVAGVMRQAVRSEDTICRYGGEEFVAILPELSVDDALTRAESIRHQVSELRLYYRGEALREITISIGLAVYPQNGESLDQLLSLADRALYEAKHLGRNRVVLAEHVAAPQPAQADSAVAASQVSAW
jgi:diguanylate cyclase (GGDEF)-like protein